MEVTVLLVAQQATHLLGDKSYNLFGNIPSINFQRRIKQWIASDFLPSVVLTIATISTHWKVRDDRSALSNAKRQARQVKVASHHIQLVL